MNKTFPLRRAIAAMAASLCVGAQGAQAGPAPIKAPTIETLAQFPAMSGIQISPDGKHMLAIESKGDDRHILVWDTARLSAPPVIIGSNPKSQISRASFLKNDMLQVTMFQPYDLRYDGVLKTFIGKLWFTDLEGKAWTAPMAATGGGATDREKIENNLFNVAVLNRLVNDPDDVVLESDSHGEGGRAIYRYNVHTKVATRIMRLGDRDSGVMVNAQGQPWAKKRYDSDMTGAYVAIDFRGADGTWSEHFRSYVKNRDVVDIVAAGTTPGTAVIKSNVGHEFTGLYEYDIATHKTTATLFEHKYFDATGVLSVHDDESPDKDGYAGYVYEGFLGNDQYWVDTRVDAALRGVAQALGLQEIDQELVGVSGGSKAHVRAYDGVSVRLAGYHGGEVPIYVIAVTGLSYPTEYYMLRASRLQLLSKAFPAVDKRSLGSASFTYYPARDGLNIPTYLVVPNQALCGPGPYSAVIHPHGGPWARDDMGYDTFGWVPLLVSQCRVVMMPQYRGSEGWGRTLWLAGDREWGQKMQDDKDDGVKWLVSQKLVDPKRVAMFGFSYGGYASFAASVRPNGLYKCAIAGAGVSDIERIWAAFYRNPFYKDAQEATVRGLSPLTLADKVQIPIMVYHGDRDTTVPLIQSKLFVDKAQAAGRPVEFHLLTDYAHGPAWKRSTNAEQLQLINDYLTKGCGGAGL